MYDVIVIGGGASGLTVANVAKRRGKKVLVLESNAKVGKKILTAGNGRCNIGNENVLPQHYNTDFVAKFLAKGNKVAEFFDEMGITTRVIEGRIYPYTESGTTVLNALRKNIAEDIVSERTVERIERKDGHYSVCGYATKAVAVCTGGITSGGKDSYSLLTDFGHNKSALYPVLSPLKSETQYVKTMSGIRVKANLTLSVDGKLAHKEYGELLFKDNGISGIVSMNISRYVKIGRENVVSVDFAPEYKEEEIAERAEGLFQKAVFLAIDKQAKERKIPFFKCAKDFLVKKISLGDKAVAHVTRGGIVPAEFDDNLMSKLAKDIYACGEVLDVDGACGGYNLHWAFLSGIVVGESV